MNIIGKLFAILVGVTGLIWGVVGLSSGEIVGGLLGLAVLAFGVLVYWAADREGRKSISIK